MKWKKHYLTNWDLGYIFRQKIESLFVECSAEV